MRMRLRQVAFVAADLGPVEQQIENELGVELCYRDPGVGKYGLTNALYPVGDKLLEVVCPTEDGTTAGRLLEKRNGDGGYMVILQVEDLAAVRSRIDQHGIRIVSEPKGEGVVGLHLHPKDVGGAILSVDQTEKWDDWGWAGPTWREHIKTGTVTDMVGVAIQSADPAAMAKRWATVLGRDVTAQGSESHIQLDEGVLQFVPTGDDRGDGVSAIDVRAADGAARTTNLCGVAVNFVA